MRCLTGRHEWSCQACVTWCCDGHRPAMVLASEPDGVHTHRDPETGSGWTWVVSEPPAPAPPRRVYRTRIRHDWTPPAGGLPEYPAGYGRRGEA